jgi:hypothetical protein
LLVQLRGGYTTTLGYYPPPPLLALTNVWGVYYDVLPPPTSTTPRARNHVGGVP